MSFINSMQLNLKRYFRYIKNTLFNNDIPKYVVLCG